MENWGKEKRKEYTLKNLSCSQKSFYNLWFLSLLVFSHVVSAAAVVVVAAAVVVYVVAVIFESFPNVLNFFELFWIKVENWSIIFFSKNVIFEYFSDIFPF